MAKDPKDHAFRAFVHDEMHCVQCGFPEAMHTEKAKCEVCDDHKGPLQVFRTILMCQACRQKEQEAIANNEASAEQRVVEQRESFVKRQAADMMKELDASITIRTDYFNADIPSVMSIKAIIDADETYATVDAKRFALALAIRERFEKDKKILFEVREVETKIASTMRAMQSYMSDLASTMKAEERAKLQLENINYKPTPPKVDKQPKPISVKAKIDKHAMREMAAKHGIPEAALQMLAVSTKSLDAALKLYNCKCPLCVPPVSV